MSVELMIYLAGVADGLRVAADVVMVLSGILLVPIGLPVTILMMSRESVRSDDEDMKALKVFFKTTLAAFLISVAINIFVPSRNTILAMHTLPIVEKHGIEVVDKAFEKLEKIVKEKK